ncbi:DUF1631 domain-containing protein [Xanthomonas maliensis]|uniref:DUF1631 domain-containing protein n=1 Tax=Xanthomonas maliensis TaxID=1321368 RepID=UPI0003A2EEE2|nr:DUF1631 domain-containing protein [Xanthomonas maliensis]KAB7762865.1 DUF1631 domain-containing protein [Xanthomonas maliensis]
MSTPAPFAQTALAAPLASAPLAPRARRLLAAAHAQCAQVLGGSLRMTIVELERELLYQAEHAPSSQLQAEIYTQTRGLRDHVEGFPDAFLQQVAQQLADLGKPLAEPTPAPQRQHAQTLTLVEDNDIDRDIVLSEIARRETSRHSNLLHLLAQRLAVVGAVPEFDLELLPLGPYGLCRIVRTLGETLQLGLDSQITLYRVFERQVADRLADLYERVNGLLAHEGILPGLIYHPYLAKPTHAQARRRTAEAGDGGHSSATGKPSAGQSPSPVQLTAWQRALMDDRSGMALATGAPPSDTTAAPGGLAEATGMLEALLTSARTARLQGHAPVVRNAGPDTTPGIAGSPAQLVAALTPPVPQAAVQDVLASLQSSVPTPTPSAPTGIAAVQRQLLAALQQQHGPHASLSPQDNDTFDLLGLLYAQMQRDVRRQAPAQDLLAKLQVPVLRAALNDPQFFVRDQHPVRELLNTVAESGATWLGEDDVDAQLLQTLGRNVERIVRDYQGDDAVFVRANEEVQAQLRTQARKAEVAERRQVDAARGRERLEMAKQQAATRIEQVCSETEPPRFVQSLLRQAWSDVLTLTLLRQGGQSSEWSERQALTARIAETTCRAKDQPADVELASEVETALLQVGYHGDEAAAIARRLSTPGGEDAVTSRTELAARLKARARLGDQGDASESAPHKHSIAPRSADEEACYQQLRSLPFGSWFEFVVNQQGDVRRQRLSWYSPVTDHALFVNQRGQKVGEQSLDALARLMASGQARLLVEEKTRLIDRAWHATVRTLRSLAGHHAQEQA